jgi:hypothetical protein
MTLDAGRFNVDDLCRIAANSASKGAALTIVNAGRLSVDNLCRVAANGRGAVRFTD